MVNQVGKNNKIYLLIVFLFSPLMALVVSGKNYKDIFSKNIIWIYCVFYGYTLVISNPEIDANRLRDYFIEFTTLKNYSFSEFVSNLYDVNSWNTDILADFLNWSVSRFTDDYKLYFAILGLIYGYFYSRNIWYLIERAKQDVNRNSVLFILAFSLLIAFWGINIFRFNTAAQIFFFGCIRFFLEKKKKYILVAILSLFVHFSFLLPSIVLLLFSFFGNRYKIYFTLFIASFVVAELNIELFTKFNLPFLPDVYEKKFNSYTGEEYVHTVDAIKNLEKNWYITASALMLKLIMVTTLSLTFMKSLQKVKESRLLALFCFTLLIVTASNLISHVPAVDRFVTVAYLFVFSFLFLFFQRNIDINWYNKIKPLIIIGITLYTIVEIRIGTDTIGLRSISSPLISLFIDEDIALINVFK